MTKSEWMTKNGFDENGLTWCVFGDNTYSIKDELKALGCKYHPILQWHSPEPLDVPTGYGMFSLRLTDVAVWDEINQAFFFTEDGITAIDAKFASYNGTSLSQFVGKIGEHLIATTALLRSHQLYNCQYGLTNIYTFSIGDDILVWVTSTSPDISVGDVVSLSGTIVKHEVRKGTKTTRISRCKVCAIG